MGDLRVTDRGDCVRFDVRVQPRASRDGVDGVVGTALKVRVTAPPVDGAANEALIAVLAEALGLPRRAIRVVAGQSGRSKVVEVDGDGAAQVRALAATLAIRSSG